MNTRGRISTKELSELLQASTVTIRNDINKLDDLGFIKKVHGGALSNAKVSNSEIPAVAKSFYQTTEKIEIGRLAASLVHDGDIIILDSGSTILEVANAVTARDLTIITNDIQTAYVLACNKHVSLIVAGGTCEPNLFTLSGDLPVKLFESLRVDIAFLGCDALDFREGISNRTFSEVAIKRAMMNAANRVVAVVDSSKLGTSVFANVCKMEEIDVLITDTIQDSDRSICDSLGVTVLTPDKGGKHGR